ncbi:MAG: hypothetical protein ABH854_03085 [Candidatus Diapherotrites archaeon]|nr:hypothetical protein [Candidatus Micrarchaeota archaeon]MBU1939543.1 hypothetical protein [Candidatus Micrarchaeota archaeon]
MAIVDEQGIIDTYSEPCRISCKKYKEYSDLVKGNPSIGYKRCAKILDIFQGQARWWHTKGSKRAVPRPLKAVEKLEVAGLLPFTERHGHAGIIFNILGTIFGDGCIDKRLNTMSFISSDKRDVDLWEKDLIKAFPYAKGKMNLIEGGEYGHSYNIRTFDRSVVRFFSALGAPVGSKVSQNYSLPRYIFGLSRKNRAAFLDGLFASEISTPVFRSDIRWVKTKRFTNFALGLSKIDSLESEHRVFLKSLTQLCNSVGVTLTPNVRKDVSKATLRKDGNTSFCYRVFFQTHFGKVLKFNELFPLRYAVGKKEHLEDEVKYALKYRGLACN